jgi:hypothetical protein
MGPKTVSAAYENHYATGANVITTLDGAILIHSIVCIRILLLGEGEGAALSFEFAFFRKV